MQKCNHCHDACRSAANFSKAEADIHNHNDRCKDNGYNTLFKELSAQHRVNVVDVLCGNAVIRISFLQGLEQLGLVLGGQTTRLGQADNQVGLTGGAVFLLLNGGRLSQRLLYCLFKGGRVHLSGVGIGCNRTSLKLNIQSRSHKDGDQQDQNHGNNRDGEKDFSLSNDVQIHYFSPP